MRRRRRRGSDEINLTPLLDVLFSILFISLLAGQGLSDRQQQQIDQMEQQIAGYEDQLASYEEYDRDAVIVTLRNVEGRLTISRGSDEDAIALGEDGAGRVARWLEQKVDGYLAEAENEPIYIVFYCDREHIYTTDYNAIVNTMTALERGHKEVFWKQTQEG